MIVCFILNFNILTFSCNKKALLKFNYLFHPPHTSSLQCDTAAKFSEKNIIYWRISFFFRLSKTDEPAFDLLLRCFPPGANKVSWPRGISNFKDTAKSLFTAEDFFESYCYQYKFFWWLTGGRESCDPIRVGTTAMPISALNQLYVAA